MAPQQAHCHLFLPILACLDEVQAELLYNRRRRQKVKVQVFYVMGKGCQASYPVPVTGLVVFLPRTSRSEM